MAHDLVIKNGMLIDGSGSEPIRADVIVNDGRITGIGDSGLEKAEQVLDATGRIVTPGFIDAHTHLDAQVGWDPALTPSIYHGITTSLWRIAELPSRQFRRVTNPNWRKLWRG